MDLGVVVGFDYPAADQFGSHASGSPSRSLVPWADYRQPRRRCRGPFASMEGAEKLVATQRGQAFLSGKVRWALN